MQKWYKDPKIEIKFSQYPIIEERYICPCTPKEEKEDILKKPYKNLEDLIVEVVYKEDTPRILREILVDDKTIYSFTIPKNYLFDGASIPRLFWRLIGSNTDNSFLVAAMVHDYMCENHSAVNNNRYLSTLIFEALLNVGGVNKFKRWIMKHSVDNYQKFCNWREE